jgi:hypothetical protein
MTESVESQSTSRSVKDFFEGELVRTPVDVNQGLRASYVDRDKLVMKGFRLAIEHVQELVLPDVLSSVFLTEKQERFLLNALMNSVNITDVFDGPNTRKTPLLLNGTYSSPILSIAAYLNSLVSGKVAPNDSVQQGVRKEVSTALQDQGNQGEPLQHDVVDIYGDEARI